jgi:protein FAM50
MEDMFRDDARKIKKRKKVAKATLSFALDDEESEEVGSREGSSKGKEDEEDVPPTKRSRSHKNPDVDTSFLPDRDREEAERRERERLRVEWLTKQEQMKDEDIEITYSYWDGSGHRKSVLVGMLSLCSSMPLTPIMVVQKGRWRCNVPRKMSATVSRATGY